jgi:hypothetical protein
MKTPDWSRRRARLRALALLAVMLVSQSLPALAAEPQLLVTYDDGTLRAVDTLGLIVHTVGAISAGTPITAIARASTGLLYAVGDTTGTPALYTIDPSNGDAVLVGPLGIAKGFDAYFDGLTFDAAGALLLSYSEFGDGAAILPSAQLYRVNIGTGHATAIGSSHDPNKALVTGLAGACDGTVYARVNRPAGSRLAKVNLSTGALTLLGAGGSESPVLDIDITIAHSTGTLWAVSPDGSAYRVDKTSGALTLAGITLEQSGHLPGSVAADPLSACRFKRSLTLAYSKASKAFIGAITTQSAPCRKGVQVSVHHLKPSGDVLIGSDKTDSAGHYVLPAVQHAGTYYATTAKSSGGLGTCLSAKSSRVTVKTG